jgi:peroxiredoxin/YHS domain-containing protein
MRKCFVAAVFIAAAGAAPGLQDDRAPVNRTCPVMKGKAIDGEYMSVHNGSPIAFCCETCKKKFDDDPGEYAANLATANEPPPRPAGPPQLGKAAPDFELRDTAGYLAKLSDFKDRIVILQWVDPDCPVARRLADKGVTAAMIARLKELSDKIVHLSVYGARAGKRHVLAHFLSEPKVESRGLMDTDGHVAPFFGVRTTAHVIVIDGKGVLRYSGAPDDDPAGKKGDKAVNHVVAAVAAILEGKKVKPEITKPYGTPLKPVK